MPSIEMIEPDSVSDEDIIETYHDIILAGELLTEALHRRMPAMDGHGLAPFVLRGIEQAGRRGLSQIEVSHLLRRSPSSATRLIDCMQQAGIVKRKPHPNDRRINMVTLTEQGTALLNDILNDLTQNSPALRSLQKTEISAFRRQLSQTAIIAAQNI